MLLTLACILGTVVQCVVAHTPPHIVFVVADDLGERMIILCQSLKSSNEIKMSLYLLARM